MLTYLTQNPDQYPGVGRMTVVDLMRNHAGNNETPLHVLKRMTVPVSVQEVLCRYWGRMAYVGIQHSKAQQVFSRARTAAAIRHVCVGVVLTSGCTQTRSEYNGFCNYL